MYMQSDLTRLFELIDQLEPYDLSAFPEELATTLANLSKAAGDLRRVEHDLYLGCNDTKTGTQFFAFVGPAGVTPEPEQVRRHVCALSGENPDTPPNYEDQMHLVTIEGAKVGSFDGRNLEGGL